MYRTGLERSARLLILEAGHLLSGEVRGADQSRMLQHRFESATHPKVDFGDDLGLQRIVSRLYLYTPDQPVATGAHETGATSAFSVCVPPLPPSSDGAPEKDAKRWLSDDPNVPQEWPRRAMAAL